MTFSSGLFLNLLYIKDFVAKERIIELTNLFKQLKITERQTGDEIIL